MEGFGRITAKFVRGATRLTELSNKSPLRLQPVNPPSARRVGATWCTVIGHGAGLLGGDVVDLAVTAEQGSTLLINTSSSTKVYRARSCGTAAQQRMHATVGEGALLVVAPDPVVPFQQSRYVQENVFDVEDGGSLVAVDFVNSGRSACGERWALDLYRSHSEYRRVRGGSSARDPTTSATPTPMMLCKTVLVDATELDQSTRGRANWGMDIGDFACNSFASVVLIGPRTEGVARNMLAVAAEVASRCGARVAGPQSLALKSAFGTGSARAAATGMSGADEPDCATLAAGLTLSSTLYMGISHVAVGSAGEETGATVVRIAAQVPQDIIRVLKMSLAPLEHSLGAVPYADRVHAVSSEPACAPGQATFAYKHGDPLLQSPIPRDQHSADSSSGHRGGSSTAQRSSTGRGSTASNYWALMQLADATLPTGGFAHSGGLEAAAQLGLFSPSHTSSGGGGGGQVHEEAALMDWVESAMVAHAKLQSPFAAQAHALTHEMLQVGKSNDWHWNSSDSRHMLQDLVALDATLGTHLASVGPANRASTAQGAGLLRVADIWLAAFLPTEQQGRSLIAALRAELARCGSAGHAACVFGVMGACLDLTQHETLDALHFGVARDMLTAAVRLNLVGPLHAVYMQAKLADAARSSIHVAQSTSVQVAGAGAGGVGTTSPLGGLSCRTAAGCAPLAEAAHACHDLLEMRLFQT